MQSLFHPWRSRLAQSSVGAGLLALSLAFTAPAFAIPSDGTYDASGGMTGFFTISGTQITDYSIAVGSMLFTDETQFDQAYFTSLDRTQIYTTSFSVIAIIWDTSVFNAASTNGERYLLEPFIYVSRPSSVPEPSSALMAGLGLLLLLGYGWRQRRQAGLQVG